MPSSANTFVLFDAENNPGFMQAVFARDAQGKATEVVLRLDGQEVWRAKKMR
ncbi:MAG: hypothetical protein M3209_10695 [Acidobacteriota bacterium]|nr:hypothetical protein [Acidobacteriota bacterium]